MNYKKIFKWFLVQVLILAVLIGVVEGVYFLKLKHRTISCAVFDLPLKSIPYQMDNRLGYINPADTVVHLYSIQFDSSVKNIAYSFGPNHWRVTPGDSSAKYYAIFTGCSFTFGYGLDDSETIAAKFGKYNPAFHAYNFSANGYGTCNVLAAFENNMFRKNVPEANGICIYTFIDYHINRNVGDMNSAGNWAEDFPCYKVQGDSVIHCGSFKTGRPVLTWLYKLLAKSNFVKYYGLNFPKIKSDDIRLTTLMIKKVETLYIRQFGNDNFYVLIYPGQYFDIRPYLQQLKIKFIDFPGLNLSGAKFKLWCDNHPSALAIDTLAKLLTVRLKTDSLQTLPGSK